MEVFVTGGTGFVGRSLCRQLMHAGHSVTVLSRRSAACQELPPGVGCTVGDPQKPGPWQEEAAHHQGFINLAGASIFGKWSEKYKKLLWESRVDTTRNLVEAIGRRRSDAPAVLVSASAVGYYGAAGEAELDESSPPGEDFLARLCVAWEEAARRAEEHGARVARTRFGIVLGGEGGALGQMLPFFRKGLGGPLGSGKQWVSWVHRQDLARGVADCLDSDRLAGPVNLTAPRPVRNRELAKALGRVLGKPAFLPAPAFAVKLAMGEMADVLLTGQKVLPAKLLAAGFEFRFPELEGALADLLEEDPSGAAQ
jgi:hypothetical protein